MYPLQSRCQCDLSVGEPRAGKGAAEPLPHTWATSLGMAGHTGSAPLALLQHKVQPPGIITLPKFTPTLSDTCNELTLGAGKAALTHPGCLYLTLVIYLSQHLLQAQGWF